MPDTSTQVTQWLLQEFAEGLAVAFEGMVGVRPDVTAELVDQAPELGASPLRWQQALVSMPAPAYAVALAEDAQVAGQFVMVAAGVEDSSPDDLKSTYLETLGQGFSMLARSLTTRLQREVTNGTGKESPEVPSDALWGSVGVTLGEKTITVALALPPSLIEAATVQPKAQAVAAATSGGSPEPSYSASPAPVLDQSKTFDLLLDVELPVSVSFGRAHVPLKDVLKLTTGSIVELSRAIVEPVDVIVNNCVIAKGEVVVVEGNFGVRIQHVVSRNERLRTIQ
jgi:flagellar motor switch protein FliN